MAGSTETPTAEVARLNSRKAQQPLSDRDRDLFLALLDRDTEPNEALKNAARRFKRLKTKK